MKREVFLDYEYVKKFKEDFSSATEYDSTDTFKVPKKLPKMLPKMVLKDQNGKKAQNLHDFNANEINDLSMENLKVTENKENKI